MSDEISTNEVKATPAKETNTQEPPVVLPDPIIKSPLLAVKSAEPKMRKHTFALDEKKTEQAPPKEDTDANTD